MDGEEEQEAPDDSAAAPEYPLISHRPEPEVPAAAPEPVPALPPITRNEPVNEDAQEEPEADGGWAPIPNPGIMFSDLNLTESCENVTGALLSSQDGCDLLAVPISPEEPFPLMAIFCFGSSGSIGGREYIIFKIKDGNLTL
jgi:hypothetical protein